MIALLIANSLALASLLIMLSSGLALIYGLRDVINFGHGALYMLGAYLGYSIALVGGFWIALVVSPLALALLGVAFEYLVLRPLRGRSHIEVALVTLGLGIILGQALIFVYGGEARGVDAPAALAGSARLFGLSYPLYRIFLIVMGLGSCAALAVWLRFSTSGLHVRAVSQDPSVARMMGVNADRLSLLVTCLSAAFAGVAGVLAGPYLSVDPGMDVSMIVNCLIIVVIGGTGSIAGAIVAALLFGFVQVAGSVFLPDLAALAPYLLLFGVLLIAPRGIGRGRAPA
ncbi:MAG: branched-chain amino acid ABC transporter permease [Pseudomonadota bacterium]|nr:branched-chain amino acid ABC transporter permease [Pseudomonadota bacterium]